MEREFPTQEENNNKKLRWPQPIDAPILVAMIEHGIDKSIKTKLQNDGMSKTFEALDNFSFQQESSNPDLSDNRPPNAINARLMALESIANVLKANNDTKDEPKIQLSDLEKEAEKFSLWIWEQYAEQLIEAIHGLGVQKTEYKVRAFGLEKLLREFISHNPENPEHHAVDPTTLQPKSVIIFERPTPGDPYDDSSPRLPSSGNQTPLKKKTPKPITIRETDQPKPSRQHNIQPKTVMAPEKKPHAQKKQEDLEAKDPDVREKIKENVFFIGGILPKDTMWNNDMIISAINKVPKAKNASGWAHRSKLEKLVGNGYIEQKKQKGRKGYIDVYSREDIVLAKYISTTRSRLNKRDIDKVKELIEAAFKAYDEEMAKKDQ